MKLSLAYLPPSKLKSLELKTLRFLCSNHVIITSQEFEYFIRDLRYVIKKIEEGNDNNKFCISFESIFSIEKGGEEFVFSVGYNIDGYEIKRSKNKIEEYDYNFMSYYLTICKKVNGVLTPLRRFHFDYACKQSNQPGPVFHFQFPGELSPYLIKQGVDESAYKDRFYSWLSEPRFHYFPLTFAFLMNIVFNDFNNININRIKNDPFWLGILHQNEMDLSKIYFKSCYNFLTSPNCQSTNLFFNNFYYGA